MSSELNQNASLLNPCKREMGKLLGCWRKLEASLSPSITPLHAFLVIFYALWVVGGLLQTEHSRSGKPTSPHSYDSGQAEIAEFEAEGEVELQLCALTPTWGMPAFEVASSPVISDRMPEVSAQLYTLSFLRGPPVA